VNDSQSYGHNAAASLTAAHKAPIEMLNADEPTTREPRIFQLYLQLASACFARATLPKHADAADVFRHMGKCYLAHAHDLGSSRSDRLSQLI
jgi:hypothetical protein